MSKVVLYEDKASEEEFAYSMGIQAYIFGLPLTILERERRIRLDPVQRERQSDLAPVAEINAIGNMHSLSTSDDILPYTPNNDTIYSGALLELVDEPVILTVPDILGRYWSIEVADAYTENRFYIGSRATDGYGGDHAFVGPDFKGELPEGVVVHQLPYNSVMIAIRIGVDKSHETVSTEEVRVLQRQFKLTSLSNWLAGAEGAAVPTSVKAKPDYDGPLGFYQLFADLMIDNPPTSEHAAQVEPFKYINLIPGQQFDPEKLSEPMQAGLARAVKAGEKIMDWKVKYRGITYESRWNKVAEGTYHHEYLDRAAGALGGLFVHDYVEAIYYSTYESYVPATIEGQPGTGELFDSSNQYVLHFDKGELPSTEDNGFWSITIYGPDFQLVANDINRFSISDRTEGVITNEDGSVDFYIQSECPTDAIEKQNWLPCPKDPGQLFRLNYRIYLPTYRVQHPDDVLNFIPPVTKRST